MFIRCGRGACGWSFIVGFASGVGYSVKYVYMYDAPWLIKGQVHVEDIATNLIKFNTSAFNCFYSKTN